MNPDIDDLVARHINDLAAAKEAIIAACVRYNLVAKNLHPCMVGVEVRFTRSDGVTESVDVRGLDLEQVMLINHEYNREGREESMGLPPLTYDTQACALSENRARVVHQMEPVTKPDFGDKPLQIDRVTKRCPCCGR